MTAALFVARNMVSTAHDRESESYESQLQPEVPVNVMPQCQDCCRRIFARYAFSQVKLQTVPPPSPAPLALNIWMCNVICEKLLLYRRGLWNQLAISCTSRLHPSVFLAVKHGMGLNQRRRQPTCISID